MGNVASGLAQETRYPVPCVRAVLTLRPPAMSAHGDETAGRHIRRVSQPFLGRRQWSALVRKMGIHHQQSRSFDGAQRHMKLPKDVRSGAFVVEANPMSYAQRLSVFLFVKLDQHVRECTQRSNVRELRRARFRRRHSRLQICPIRDCTQQCTCLNPINTGRPDRSRRLPGPSLALENSWTHPRN